MREMVENPPVYELRIRSIRHLPCLSVAPSLQEPTCTHPHRSICTLQKHVASLALFLLYGHESTAFHTVSGSCYEEALRTADVHDLPHPPGVTDAIHSLRCASEVTILWILKEYIDLVETARQIVEEYDASSIGRLQKVREKLHDFMSQLAEGCYRLKTTLSVRILDLSCVEYWISLSCSVASSSGKPIHQHTNDKSHFDHPPLSNLSTTTAKNGG
ncbi:udp-glucoronosyl and udp-glucosyl transferase family protein [Moniliophthora roreri]|nr:udp-glucoronosyl and udp-glucosyl transferase family protein [Moniliophthora roreri]